MRVLLLRLTIISYKKYPRLEYVHFEHPTIPPAKISFPQCRTTVLTNNFGVLLILQPL
ncbi:hypothetical protein PISMIDRAFT_363547 [Pisolithus microcarpus 441]|uniref:Unplaced genomic scaffold scaffold_27, whole genome shotgun sequence n=1 Tax=Pisolithus microcarpus 441 TaxID=765257 RepID=A0A0C9ZZ92_9AGAM|nr:hypothetical protein PISMIDRAFT_363547 [Pisolithus microcarpus 441]